MTSLLGRSSIAKVDQLVGVATLKAWTVTGSNPSLGTKYLPEKARMR